MLRIYQTDQGKSVYVPVVLGLLFFLFLSVFSIDDAGLWATSSIAAILFLRRIRRTLVQYNYEHKEEGELRQEDKSIIGRLSYIGNLLVSGGIHYLGILGINLFIIRNGFAPDGTWVALQSSIILLDAALGMPISLFNIDKKAATLEELHKLLENANEKTRMVASFSAVFEDFPEAAVEISEDKQRFVRANEVASDILGIPKDMLQDYEYQKLVHPDDLATTEQVAEIAKEAPPGSYDGFRNRYRTPAGWRWLEWRTLGGLDQFSVFRDVTDEIESAAEIVRMREQMEAMQNTNRGLEKLDKQLRGNV